MMKIITFDNIDRLSSMYYLNKAINESKLLVESYPEITSLLLESEDSHHYEWDLTNNKFYDRINNIESDIKKSASYVRTAEQGIDFIKSLVNKVSVLPDKIKLDLIKIAIASMGLTMGYNQLVKVENNIDTKSPETTMVSQALDKEIEKKESKNKEIETKEKIAPTKLTFSNTLVDSLKQEEGIGGKPVLTAYDLGDGAYTIGYGHAVFSNPNKGDNGGKYDFLPKYKEIIPGKTKITPEQAEILLKDDIGIASDALDRLLNEWAENGLKPNITQPMYDAMVSMVYNMGISKFRLSNFIQLVKNNKFEEASEAIKDTSSQMFKKYPGLINRRDNESKLFKSGLA
jgi:GH24 family phage-related lysozyme (muramidase)